ncbi:hypothetical protein STENM223S_03090 [Streptomyces tendae]
MAMITAGIRRTRLARLLSTYFAPPCLPVVAAGAVSLRITWPNADGLLWGLFGSGSWALLCAAMTPLAARAGRRPALMPAARGPRLRLLAASVLAGMGVWQACAWLGAPPELLDLGELAPLLTGLVLACTLAGNVSVHTGSAAASVTLLSLYLGAGWAVLYLLVAAIGWSRLHLRAHTPAQVVAGAVLGTTACATAVLALR